MQKEALIWNLSLLTVNEQIYLEAKFYFFPATLSVGPACVVLCFAGTPVEVGITMYVLSISSLSEVKMVLHAFTVQHPPFWNH